MFQVATQLAARDAQWQDRACALAKTSQSSRQLKSQSKRKFLNVQSGKDWNNIYFLVTVFISKEVT